MEPRSGPTPSGRIALERPTRRAGRPDRAGRRRCRRPRVSAHAQGVRGACARLQYSLSSAIPNELLRDDRRLETQLVLLRSRSVLGPVASDNGMTPEDLAKSVSAEIVNNSEIIEVEVRDRTRGRAQMLLTGIIAQYLQDGEQGLQDPVLSYLESQLSEVQKQLQAPDVSEQDAPDWPNRRRL